MTDTMRALRVFLCHASNDKLIVQNLYERLINDGIDAWLDKEELVPGQDWKLEITKVVKESDVVIVCLSKHSVTKEGFVQREIKFALEVADEKPEGTIFIIPARLEVCDVPEMLSRYQWVDLFTNNGYERLSKALHVRSKSVGATTRHSDKFIARNLQAEKKSDLLLSSQSESQANGGADASSRLYQLAHRLNLEWKYEPVETYVEIGGSRKAYNLVEEVGLVSVRYECSDEYWPLLKKRALKKLEETSNQYFPAVLEGSSILKFASLICGTLDTKIIFRPRPLHRSVVVIKSLWFDWDLRNTLIGVDCPWSEFVDSVTVHISESSALITPLKRRNPIRGQRLEKFWSSLPQNDIPPGRWTKS
jgi:hypothetical protein